MTPGKAPGKVRFARALRSRPFALLWLGQTVSELGDGAYFTALAWQVLVLTGSGAAMGAVLIAASIPRLAFLLFGGVVADRLPRRLILLAADAGRGVAVVALAALSFLHLLHVEYLLGLALLFGFADAFFMPAYQSIAPELVATEALPSANALSGLSRQMSGLIGPALGAALVTVVQPAGAFAFDGLTFAFSAVCLLLMGRSARRRPLDPLDADALETAPVSGAARERPRGKGRRGGRRRGVRGVFADIREGLRYVAGSTWIWATIVIAALGNAARQPFVVSTPKLVQDYYHADVWLFGAIFTTTALGSIVATVLFGQVRRMRRRGVIAYLGLIVSSLAMMAFALPGLTLLLPALSFSLPFTLPFALPATLAIPPDSAPTIALSAAALDGFGIGVFEIIWVTVLQELIPADKLGRVSSLDWLGSLALQPLGLAAAGILTDAIGPAWVFLIGGAINLLLTLSAFCVRGIRQLQ
jgi:MFS family permease